MQKVASPVAKSVRAMTVGGDARDGRQSTPTSHASRAVYQSAVLLATQRSYAREERSFRRTTIPSMPSSSSSAASAPRAVKETLVVRRLETPRARVT